MDAFKKSIQNPHAQPEASQVKGENSVEAKFNESCAVCGKAPTEVKWMGQYFHVKCKRQARKMAGRML